MMKNKEIIILIVLIVIAMFQFNLVAEEQSLIVDCQQHYINGMFHWTKAMMDEDDSEYSMAINEFKQAIEENPDFADAYFQLGVIYKHQGKNGEAKKMWNKATNLNPDFSDKIKDIEKSRTETIESLDIESILAELAKDQEELDKVSEVSSLHLEAQNLLFKGMQTGKDKYYNLAIDKLNKAIELNPNYAMTYLTLSNVYLYQEKFNEANESLDKAVSLNPKLKSLADNLKQSIKFLSESSSTQKKAFKKETKELIGDFKYPQKLLDMDEVEEINRQGKLALSKALLGEENKYSEAIEKLESSIVKMPRYTSSYYYLADAYAYQGNFKKAIEILDKASAIRPEAAGVVRSKKVLYEELKMYDEYEFSKYKKEQANNYLEELGLKEKEKNKQKIQGYFTEVVLLLADDEKSANVDKAIGVLNKIIELNPSSAKAYSQLGDVYFYYKESTDTAVSFYKKAVEIEHNYLEAHEGLAYCYQQLNQDEQAKKEWQRIIEINPNHKEAQEYLSE